jgi:hypothetical protein
MTSLALLLDVLALFGFALGPFYKRLMGEISRHFLDFSFLIFQIKRYPH